MAAKRKKIGAAGRFGPRAGTSVRIRLNKIESIQRKKQVCPHCGKSGVKREAAGIWHCFKCNRIFAGDAYSISQMAR
jgi:large subunit ribosomal protein L37Ae